MKPVDQTKFVETHGHGDCYRACMASILELPIEVVPDYRLAEYMDSAIDADLTARGYRRIVVNLTSGAEWGDFILNDSVYHPVGKCNISGPPVILVGKSPRGEFFHAVVGTARGKILHDPHPSRGGFDGDPKRVDFIVPLPPSLARELRAA